MINQGINECALHEAANLNKPTAQEEATGYLHPLYCESLSEFGTPRLLPESGGWILERQIPNSTQQDAMGCYPLFACHDWSRLAGDLQNIGDSLVALSLVTDPFGDYDPAHLKQCFPDLVIPFKEHFVVDLTRAPETFVNAHHQRNLRKALREIRVEESANPIDSLEEWATLYATLVERHNIKGLTTFSKESFAKQLRVPGVVLLRAMKNDVTVGMLVWYEQENRAYYHLGAYSLLGYELGASFALFEYAIRYFAGRGLAWLNLGSGAGVGQSGEQGLSRFKQGWSTGVRDTYFCGRIFNPGKYRDICETGGVQPTPYFPAYRVGEFS